MERNDNFIEQLKLKTNIVDVIGSYTVLKRSGGSYWARCPLPGHSERTPSFCVNEAGQFYKCFGCGKGGDVIKFVQEVESVDFYDAVKILADKAGMQMPEVKRERNELPKEDKDKLYSLLKDTALFYVHNLKNAPVHAKYMEKRHIDALTVKNFGLGASLDYKTLPKYLAEKGYSYEDMLACGVVYKDEKGEYLDSQAKRLIIPIIDHFGKVVAFGGRWLEKTDKAKYKNTSETKIFVKNKVLFNLNNLKKYKKEVGEIDNVIVVEGYMDAISVYKAGVKNVVASMGTSLTVSQAKLLKRYTDRVTICYDGDSAGQKGAIRGLEILKGEGLSVKIASIPNDDDPDDVINKYGVERYKEIIKSAKSLEEFKLDIINNRYGEKSKLPDKNRLIDLSLNVIKECPSVSEQEELLKTLRDNTGITYESLKRDLDKSDGKPVQSDDFKPIIPKETFDRVKQSQRFIINCVLQKKDYAKDLDLQDFLFEDPTLNKLAEMISDGDVRTEELGGLFDENELVEIDKVLKSGENVFSGKNERKYYEDCLNILKIDETEKELKALNDSFSKETDISVRNTLVKAIQEKTMKIARLKK
ncbi:MAG TPA: DNA primase [Clostridiales bacterium]|nr:DNA primase [Clostridiales bacterium]